METKEDRLAWLDAIRELTDLGKGFLQPSDYKLLEDLHKRQVYACKMKDWDADKKYAEKTGKVFNKELK